MVLGGGLFVLGLVGVVGVLLATQLGPGLREDSYSYVTAGESLAAGTGLGRWAADGTFRPLLHFPPFFPYILAGFRVLSLDLISGVRLFHAVLMGLTVVLVGMITKRMSGSMAASLMAAGFVVASASVLEVFSWVHSEPTYLLLFLLAMMGLGASLEGPQNPFYPWLAGGAAALAFATRYVGISMILAGSIVLLLPYLRPGRRGWRALVFSGLAVLPAAGFALSNYLAYGSALDRPTPAWHPPMPEAWTEGARSVLGWLLPARILGLIPVPMTHLLGASVVVALGAGMFALYLHLRRRELPKDGPSSHWALLLASTFVSYLLVVLLTVLFFDRLTPLNDRILAPLYVTAVPAVAVAAERLWSLRRPGWLRWLLAVLLIAVGLLQGYRSFRFVATTRDAGLGLSNREWQASPTIAYVRTLPDLPLYSNDLPALYFLAGRHSTFPPSSWNPASARPREDFTAALEAMRSDLRCRGGLLIVVGSNPSERLPANDRPEILEGLEVAAEFADGLVYAAPVSSCPQQAEPSTPVGAPHRSAEPTGVRWGPSLGPDL